MLFPAMKSWISMINLDFKLFEGRDISNAREMAQYLFPVPRSGQ